MLKKIQTITINDFERPGIPEMFIDFKQKNQVGYVDEIDIPERIPYMIEYQIDDSEEICALKIINFEVFMSYIETDDYLPNLGLFKYKNYQPMMLKELLKELFKNQDYE